MVASHRFANDSELPSKSHTRTGSLGTENNQLPEKKEILDPEEDTAADKP
jgi:hypothetical protein